MLLLACARLLGEMDDMGLGGRVIREAACLLHQPRTPSLRLQRLSRRCSPQKLSKPLQTSLPAHHASRRLHCATTRAAPLPALQPARQLRLLPSATVRRPSARSSQPPARSGPRPSLRSPSPARAPRASPACQCPYCCRLVARQHRAAHASLPLLLVFLCCEPQPTISEFPQS